MGFTHDNELRSGFLSGSAVTAKDIMVQPNPPRFVREGDQLEFTVKVSNRTEKEQTGKVRLTFADALTEDNVDELLGNADLDKTFTVPANQSRTYSWRLTVPDDPGLDGLPDHGIQAALDWAAASDASNGVAEAAGSSSSLPEQIPVVTVGGSSSSAVLSSASS